MLPTDDLGWLTYLARLHDSDRMKLSELNSLYEGTAPLHYLHPEVLREVEDRIQVVALGWPMIAVDPLHERLDQLGFRYSDDGDDVTEQPGVELDDSAIGADENLRRVWSDNDMDHEIQLGLLDALVMKRSYICVGAGDDPDIPLVTVESPLEVFAEINPRTRATRAALRRWADHQDSLARITEEYATLYLPDATVYYDRGPSGWRVIERDDHKMGRVSVCPMVNRSRLSDRYGKSELSPPLLSLSHAANKIATDMMVGAEFHAIPLRAIFGIGPDDMVDKEGNRRSALQVIMGRLLTIPTEKGGDVKPFEFSASSLSNFHDTLNQLARHAAGLLGLDPHEFGFTTDNPASAEALRARESRLIRRTERKQTAFGLAMKQAAQLVRRYQDGDWDPRAKRLKVIWKDAATPTKAAAADAATKLFSANIVPLRQTREDLGYTPGEIRRMEAEDDKARQADPLADIARGMAEPPPMPVPAPEPEPVGVS